MENIDMKSFWLEESRKMELKIGVNEALLKTVIREKATTTFTKLLKISILGRNLALVYAAIAGYYAIHTINASLYSIPAMLGAVAMVWSFFMHRSLKQADFTVMPILELQRNISKFRIHTGKMAIYDIGIVMFWLITIAPAFMFANFNIAMYSLSKVAFSFGMVCVMVIAAAYLLSRKMYREYHDDLKASEGLLERISEFDGKE